MECGNNLRNSVYEITNFPTPVINVDDNYQWLHFEYLGCYKDLDGENRALNPYYLAFDTRFSDEKNVWFCLRTCYEAGKSYFGFEFNLCFCGNEYGMYGPTDNECPIYDDSFSYGSHWSMSVYKINDFAVIPTSEDDGWFMSDTSLKIERLKGFLRSV